MSRQQNIEGEQVTHLSRAWLPFWFVAQWLVLPGELIVRCAVHLVMAVFETYNAGPVDWFKTAHLFLGPRRFAREWSRDPLRWEAHYRSVLTELAEEARKRGHGFHARLVHAAELVAATGNEPQQAVFRVYPRDYRGCGRSKALRVAQAEGWTAVAEKEEWAGIVLSVPHLTT
ncbi:hypothetical protein [Streptomyces sp. NPDC003077]|uniref:hypothetical protein n=1 Tax=Streptomyces sp. NPDC003077 TaxID=3154443 RepID=UPI0033B1CF95